MDHRRVALPEEIAKLLAVYLFVYRANELLSPKAFLLVRFVSEVIRVAV